MQDVSSEEIKEGVITLFNDCMTLFVVIGTRQKQNSGCQNEPFIMIIIIISLIVSYEDLIFFE